MAKRRGRRAPGGTPGVMPAQLRRSYLSGKVAARIRWGAPRDSYRCVAQARKHGVPARMRWGMCNKLHTAKLGAPPGKGHGGGRGHHAPKRGKR